MADTFNPNEYYDYPYKYVTGVGTSTTKYLSLRASDGKIRMPRGGSYSYYDSLQELQRDRVNSAMHVANAGGRMPTTDFGQLHTAEKKALTEATARYTTYKADFSSQQAAAAQAHGAALRKRMGLKSEGIAEKRKLKKPTDGKPKIRKGAKGGIATLKKPGAGVVI